MGRDPKETGRVSLISRVLIPSPGYSIRNSRSLQRQICVGIESWSGKETWHRSVLAYWVGDIGVAIEGPAGDIAHGIMASGGKRPPLAGDLYLCEKQDHRGGGGARDTAAFLPRF